MSAKLPLILIVDDNPENLSVVGELLQPLCDVRVANSGPRALQLARSDPAPQLILLDVMMPGMDGFEVLAHLRADPTTRDIAVIFLSALSSEHDEARALAAGAVDYLSKPIRPAALLARIKTQIDAQTTRRQARETVAELRAQVQHLHGLLRVHEGSGPVSKTPDWLARQGGGPL